MGTKKPRRGRRDDVGGWLAKLCDNATHDQRYGHHRWEENADVAVLLPPADELAEMCRDVGRRYGDQVALIEFKNEVNGICAPETFIERITSIAYPVLKKEVGDVPVVINTTVDFGLDGSSYVGDYYAAGGLQYCDGFTFHPYGGEYISEGALPKADIYQSRLTPPGLEPGRTLVAGQSECLHISHRWSQAGWEVAQRALIDWSSGFRWSTGGGVGEAYHTTAGQPSNWALRGPFLAPNTGALAINAMHGVLAGARQRGRVDVGPDVMIALFDQGDGCAAAVAATDAYASWALIDVDLRGLDVTAYDQWGAPVALPDVLLVDREVLYLRCDDPAMLDRLRAASVQVLDRIDNRVQQSWGVGDADQRAYVHSGHLAISRGADLRRWHLRAGSKSDGDPLVQGLVDAGGARLGSWTEAVRVEAPGVFYPGPQRAHRSLRERAGEVEVEPLLPAERFYAATDVLSLTTAEHPLRVSCAGLTDLALWVNGERVDLPPLSSLRRLGRDWLEVSLPWRAGVNHVLLACDVADMNALSVVRVRGGELDPVDGGSLLATPGIRLDEAALAKPVPAKATAKAKARAAAQLAGKVAGLMRLFDGNINSGAKLAANDVVPFTFLDGQSYRIERYRFMPPHNVEHLPTEWVIEGSNDGTRWHEVDRQRLAELKPKPRKSRWYDITCVAPAKYRHYRITFPAAAGARFSLHELVFLGRP
jgi:hypothetical protein